MASSRPPLNPRRRPRPSTATGNDRSRVQRFPLLPTRFGRFLRGAVRRRTVDPGRRRLVTLDGMDCSKKSKGAVPNLPDDCLVDILSRVPAKSVCRFKCVSKAWVDLIDHPEHRKKLRQAMQGLFYLTTKILGDGEGNVMCRFGFIDLLTARSVPLDIDPGFSFLTELPGFKILMFLDSCNGLILFGHPMQQDPDDADAEWVNACGYVVCNPTTKQWVAVPVGGSPIHPHLTSTKLAFDPAVSSHFYLLQFAMDEEGNLMSLHAYSSETGIWGHNQTEEQEGQGELEGWLHQFELKLMIGPSLPDCAFLNGFLHFGVSGRHLDKIVALDLQGKARRMIEAPTLHHRRRWAYYLGQSQGQLHYIIQGLRRRRGEGHRLDIWVLKDYGKEEWELKDTLNFKVVCNCRIDPSDLQVVCIHPDRNVVFFHHALRLIAYDMDRREVSVVTILGGDENQEWRFARYFPYFSESPSLLTNEH